MAKRIFGLNLAKIVNDAMTSAGGLPKGKLIKEGPAVRTGTEVTATSNTYNFQGSEGKAAVRDDAGIVVSWAGTVRIMGASLPNGIVPATNDKVVMLNDDGTDAEHYTLKELIRSSSSGTSYTFIVE